MVFSVRGSKIKKQDLCTSFRGGASKLPPKKRKVVYKSPSIIELFAFDLAKGIVEEIGR
jgi:hypothetical protein